MPDLKALMQAAMNQGMYGPTYVDRKSTRLNSSH